MRCLVSPVPCQNPAPRTDARAAELAATTSAFRGPPLANPAATEAQADLRLRLLRLSASLAAEELRSPPPHRQAAATSTTGSPSSSVASSPSAKVRRMSFASGTTAAPASTGSPPVPAAAPARQPPLLAAAAPAPVLATPTAALPGYHLFAPTAGPTAADGGALLALQLQLARQQLALQEEEQKLALATLLRQAAATGGGGGGGNLWAPALPPAQPHAHYLPAAATASLFQMTTGAYTASAPEQSDGNSTSSLQSPPLALPALAAPPSAAAAAAYSAQARLGLGASCSKCTRRFATREELAAHAQEHAHDGKPYRCRWRGCGRAFADASNVKRHEKSHLGAKPFLCSLDGCGSTFTRRSSLKLHMSSVHNLSKDDERYVAALQRRPVSHDASVANMLDLSLPIQRP